MRLTYANCLLGGLEPGDALATDEPLVADGATVPVIVPDADFDADEAQALNERMWALGFAWPGDPDPTLVDGISAADLAGVEATQKILLPAVRGVLEADAILREVQPTELRDGRRRQCRRGVRAGGAGPMRGGGRDPARPARRAGGAGGAVSPIRQRRAGGEVRLHPQPALGRRRRRRPATAVRRRHRGRQPRRSPA